MLDEMAGKEGMFNSEAARELLLGTANQETDLMPREQDPRIQDGKLVKGDANGLFQMEKQTFDWLMNEYLPKYFPKILNDIKRAFTPAGGKLDHTQLLKDPTFAAVMARMKYYSTPAPLPEAGNLDAQAKCWMKFYNGSYSKEKLEQYKSKWKKLQNEKKK